MPLVLLLQLLAATPDPPAVPPSAPPPVAAPQPPPTWYGWQTLSSDGLAAVLIGTAYGLANIPEVHPGGFAGFGIFIYSLGPPVVHLVHGRFWAGLGDLGLRIAGAGGGALLGLLAGFGIPLPDLNRAAWGAAIGATVMGIGVAAVDAAALAWEPASAAPPAAATASLPSWTLFAGTLRGAPMAGIAGAF